MPPPVDGSDLPSAPPPPLAEFGGARVLVTGATGFIGGHVVDLLHRLGAEVHAIHRRDAPTTSFNSPVRWHRADLTDAGATGRAVAAARPEHVVHLASLVKGARDPELILPMFRANAASTVHVLDAARACGVRRVQLAGSLEEPDPGEVGASPYAVSKAASHLYGDHYRVATGLEVVNLQIFMVYGPATPDETKLIPYVVNQLLAGGTPELTSGTRLVDWVHVGDVAEGIVRCAQVATAPTEPVPLGTGQLHSVRQVVEWLVEVAGSSVEPRFGSLADRADEVVRAAEVERTRFQLGWAPGIDLGRGLVDTFAWYEARLRELPS